MLYVMKRTVVLILNDNVVFLVLTGFKSDICFYIFSCSRNAHGAHVTLVKKPQLKNNSFSKL